MVERSEGIQTTRIFFHQSFNKPLDQTQRDKGLFQCKNRQPHKLAHTHPKGFLILHPSGVDLEEHTQQLHPSLFGKAQLTIELQGPRELHGTILSAKEEFGLFVESLEDRDGPIIPIPSFFEHFQQHIDLPLRKEVQLSAETTHDHLQFGFLLFPSYGQLPHRRVISSHGEGVQHANSLPSLERLVLSKQLMGKSQQLLLFLRTASEGTKKERPERFGENFKHGYQLCLATPIESIMLKQTYISSQPTDFPIQSLDDREKWLIIGLQEMKITAELIQHSPQFTNPLNQRQLDLRGYKITAIQNMGATLNFFECIDLSDNELRRLGNFTNLDRLTSIVATNNRIKAISPDLAESLPNLENIFLMNNKIGELEEIAKLAACKKLQRLVLANNLVAELPNYRLFAIAKIPSLRILDFAKISTKQRRQAEAMFGGEQLGKK